MPLTLAQWTDDVAYHLRRIEYGANECSRSAKLLPVRPPWESRSETAMAAAETALEAALATVRAALTIYREKEIDR